MNPERVRQIEELYHAARECSASERQSLLDRADPELRNRVESLLAQDNLDGPIDRPMAWCHDHVAFIIDEFLLTGRTPIPLERELLVTGIVDAALTSRYLGGVRVETPHLAIEYAGPGPTTPHLQISLSDEVPV